MMLSNASRFALALLLAVSLLFSGDVEARNAGPRLSAKQYDQKARSLNARGNRQYKLYKKSGNAKQKQFAVKNHQKAKVYQLKAKAAKALSKGDKTTADKLWTQASQLESALIGGTLLSTPKAVTAQPKSLTPAPSKGMVKRNAGSFNEHKKTYESKLSLSRQQRAQAETSGDTSLLHKSAVNRAAASKAMVSMLKTQETGLRLKAARTNDPAKQAQYLTKADTLASRAGRLNRAIQAYEAKLPTAAANTQAGTVQPGNSQVPDAEQPVIGAKAGTYKQLKQYVANKDLNSALGVLKSMEAEAAGATGIKGLWKKTQVARARRALRKGATAAGIEAIRTGGASQDQQLVEQRREYANQVRQLRTAGITPEQRQQLRAEIAQVPSLRTNGSRYAQARAVLRHLNQKGKKFEKRPVRRVIAALGNLVFGSARSSHKKLDRALLKEARYLTKQGPDGAVQARLLVLSAKSRGMDRSWNYRLTHRKARRALSNTIKKAIKSGDAAGVELAYQLRESYEMDRKGPDYRISEREIRTMDKQIAKAELNLVKNLAKQAAWIAKYPKQAQMYFGYGPDAAATVNNLARETASRLMQNGAAVPNKLMRQMNKTDSKLNQRKPGLLTRIATLPIKIALVPFKILHWATINQARHFVYNKTGGAPPPPMQPEQLNQLMQSHMPRQQDMQQGYGAAPQTPADAMM